MNVDIQGGHLMTMWTFRGSSDDNVDTKRGHLDIKVNMQIQGCHLR